MDDAQQNGSGESLMARLEVIEAQPLDARAAAYGALRDEIARLLDSAPSAPA